MNYAQQQSYLKQSRFWAMPLVLVWLLIAAISFAVIPMSAQAAVASGGVVVAIAVSLLYTPDYLHLTVNSSKKPRWGIMIRWRIVGIVLVLGIALFLSASRTNREALILVVIALCWLAAANLLARRLWSGLSVYFWATDLALLVGLLLLGNVSVLFIAGVLALAVHLSLLICRRRIFTWAAAVILMAWLLLLGACMRFGGGRALVLGGAIVFISGAATAWLVHCAQEQNSRNIQSALQELMEFTGYPEERILRLWSQSDKELARNWVAAALDEDDTQALAEWYRQNSELYMFAISGYNLDYKRIRSNLKVLRNAQGACLDYGAGNGEIVLELARRGHSVTYYDVDGVSARFAKHRAQQQGLKVAFAHSKQELSSGFDTIFSLDVLEHLPDLPGELTFLASLLNRGGRFVFDVPAGSTKSHPMHLNHNTEVRSVLNGKGLREQRKFWQKLPFVKQEKYVFERNQKSAAGSQESEDSPAINESK